MKDVLFKIRRILGGAITLLALTALGFFTDNPKTMIPVYFVFFLLVFLGVYFYTNHRFKNTKQIVGVRLAKEKRRLTAQEETKSIPKIVQGSVLVGLSLFVPTYIFSDVGFTAGIHILLVFLTLILVLTAIAAVYLINKKTLLHSIIGYAVLVIVCSMPAIMMVQHDRSYHALGTAYYSAIVITVLSWYGASLILKNVTLPKFLT